MGRLADFLDFEANEGDTDALSGLCVPTPPTPPSQGGERKISSLRLAWLGVLGLVFFGLPPAHAERMSFLENGSVKIGVDLDQGGTITFLARADGGENVINCHDLGRQVQQSYYSGPHPFGTAHPGWKGWPWNPIGSGDVYHHPSRVIEHTNDKTTLYVKTVPMQWALDNVPGECTFETWITLDGKTALVRNRLVNHRPDKTQYPAHDQELPAVYTIGKLHRLLTYAGDRPFENEPLKRIHNAGPPWARWKASENWAALVDDQGWGLGVIHPGVYAFLGGFHGKPNTGGSRDNSTGYIAPVRKEVLDHNIVYEYHYLLVLGPLAEIRTVATARRLNDSRPDYHFRHDRQHWILSGVADTGFPIEGCLCLTNGPRGPQLISPEQWWRADEVPRLYVRAAFRTRSDRAAIFWSVPQGGFSGERRLEFVIRPDGEFHDYALDLASVPTYRGTITGLRLDPTDSLGPGDEVRIASISWRTN